MRKLNYSKLDRIQRVGQEVDLPLFGGGTEDPTYLPNNGKDTKSLSYEKLKLNNNELIILAIVRKIGPCTDQEIAEELRWEINQVTGRRNSLVGNNRVERCGTVSGPKGRKRALWRVVSLYVNIFFISVSQIVAY